MKKILIPTDGSILADYAYELAHDIANRTAAYIDIVSVVSTPPMIVSEYAGPFTYPTTDQFPSLSDEQENMERRLSKWAKDKPDIQSVSVRIGEIEKEILAYVNENEVDLIVMGTEGARGLDEVLGGSHVEQIVQRSPIPVLCLKSDRSRMMVKDLLFIGDFELPARINLDLLKELQRAYQATLHLLRVNTPSRFLSTGKAMENMERFAELNELSQVEYHLYCEESIEQGIIHLSREKKIDLLAIGTNQRSSLARLFNPSISRAVVNHIQQPILTFRM